MNQRQWDNLRPEDLPPPTYIECHECGSETHFSRMGHDPIMDRPVCVDCGGAQEDYEPDPDEARDAMRDDFPAEFRRMSLGGVS